MAGGRDGVARPPTARQLGIEGALSLLQVLLDAGPPLVVYLDNLESLQRGPASGDPGDFADWRDAECATLWRGLRELLGRYPDRLALLASSRYRNPDFAGAVTPFRRLRRCAVAAAALVSQPAPAGGGGWALSYEMHPLVGRLAAGRSDRAKALGSGRHRPTTLKTSSGRTRPRLRISRCARSRRNPRSIGSAAAGSRDGSRSVARTFSMSESAYAPLAIGSGCRPSVSLMGHGG